MKISILITLLFLTGYTQAQTVEFSEDFETLPLSVTSSGSSNWARTTTFSKSGSYSDSASIISAGDTTYLTTNTFSTTGKSSVLLEFNHICKLSYADGGYIEYSTDNGSTWTRIIGNSYIGYGNFVNIGNRFSAVSYVNEWDAVHNNTTPQNTWWQGELFDLSSLIGNSSQVKLRFVLADADNNGSSGTYGWLLDDIKITSSNSELNPPNISIINPYPIDTVYTTGPFTIDANISDTSGIALANLVYEIAGVYDTIQMNNISGSIFRAIIPSQSYSTDICYHIYAIDSSSNSNENRYPITNCTPFTIQLDPSIPTPFAYDAKLHIVESPDSITLANSQTPIIIRISNRGDSVLTKSGIGWKMDGVTQSNTTWNGSLSLHQVSDTLLLGSSIFQQGYHNITAHGS